MKLVFVPHPVPLPLPPALAAQAAALPGVWLLYKEHQAVGAALVRPADPEHPACLLWWGIAPQWRGRGYGRYLLRSLLRAPGPAPQTAALPPADSAAAALLSKAGFAPNADGLLHRNGPPRSGAVDFLQRELTARFAGGSLSTCIDATCGNGGDTLFLARLAGPQGRVLALDLQRQAVENTRVRLAQAGQGLAAVTLCCADHARLGSLAAEHGFSPAQLIMFNFGWLPGADHSLTSTAAGSLPALRAALHLLAPGGVLSICLYTPGYGPQEAEKQAVLDWLNHLPAADYRVRICRFADWADTAPLPCLVTRL